MANYHRRTAAVPSSLLSEDDSHFNSSKRPTYRYERGSNTQWLVETLPILVKRTAHHSPISRGTASSPQKASNLPCPVSSLRRPVNNSPAPVSSSRFRLGKEPVNIKLSSRTRINDTNGSPSPNRPSKGPSSNSQYTKTAASTARRIPSSSPGLTSSLHQTDNKRGKLHQRRDFLPELTARDIEFLENSKSSSPNFSGPCLSRRNQVSNLPYSASSPNIKKLSDSNENTPPVPFAPKSELHERVLHGRRGSAHTNNYYPHPLYSNPTVASSALTASASSTDISQPHSHNQRIPDRDSSRIPSPTSGSNLKSTSRRHLHSPVRRAIEKGEESRARRRHASPVWGLPHIQTNRTSPAGSYQIAFKTSELTPEPKQESTSLPKSRTFGVFTTLKNSSSIQWLHSNRPTSNPTHSAGPTISTTKYSPTPEFTTNTLQVHTAQPFAYWCGRFQAVSDRYQSEDFHVCVINPLPVPRDSDIKREKPSSHYRRTGKIHREANSPLKSDSPAPFLEKSHRKTPVKSYKTVLAFSTPAHFLEDFDKRAQKVMVFLASLCCTSPAKKSLREWQIQYATVMKNKALMPRNDADDKGFFGRMGRVISDGVNGTKNGTSGRGTVMGKRSAFSLRKGGRSAAEDH
ncbi:uncharacterized protein EAF01_009924 [Botrytis porri]|uniref:Uncharacterized protein n=1 Tax=Botrytis porri TaxID=87229 RepID=A0A4Z1L431_9HELO|nr:uncharacterized protein EAF01_009924 [Botrytis porri]KAF7894473.1 hypothetical protein EAF01_009924 [Botrytis porri]TGO91551.1 hypothetical protein BPOR_0024g00070 [Botrytis porri]